MSGRRELGPGWKAWPSWFGLGFSFHGDGIKVDLSPTREDEPPHLTVWEAVITAERVPATHPAKRVEIVRASTHWDAADHVEEWVRMQQGGTGE